MKVKVAVPIAAAALVAFPGVAHADQQGFLNDARAAGYTQPDEELVRDAYVVCAASAQSGVTDDLIGRGINAVQRFLGHPDSPSSDQQFIDIAQKHFCPAVAQ